MTLLYQNKAKIKALFLYFKCPGNGSESSDYGVVQGAFGGVACTGSCAEENGVCRAIRHDRLGHRRLLVSLCIEAPLHAAIGGIYGGHRTQGIA